jgi:hypothetical protein
MTLQSADLHHHSSPGAGYCEEEQPRPTTYCSGPEKAAALGSCV